MVDDYYYALEFAHAYSSSDSSLSLCIGGCSEAMDKMLLNQEPLGSLAFIRFCA